MYRFFVVVLAFIIRIVNGKRYEGISPEYDEKQTYLVIAPHRSMLDPIFLAMTLSPRQIHFIAKQELLQLPVIGWLIRHVGVIPVNREKPSRKTMKTSLNYLKNQELVGIFPTGSRFSDEMKAGYLMLAQLGKVPILPVVYQGPIAIKDLFSWKKEKRVAVEVGAPIKLPDKRRLTAEDEAAITEKVERTFEELEAKMSVWRQAD